jgi:hypothetical protein
MNALRLTLSFIIPAALAVTFLLWALWRFWLEGRK